MSVSLAILILYIIALFGISWFAKKRSEGNAENYALAGRRLSRRLSRSRSSVWLLAGLRDRCFRACFQGRFICRLVYYCLGNRRYRDGYFYGEEIPRAKHHYYF